jgi:hypothetical protein
MSFGTLVVSTPLIETINFSTFNFKVSACVLIPNPGLQALSLQLRRVLGLERELAVPMQPLGYKPMLSFYTHGGGSHDASV